MCDACGAFSPAEEDEVARLAADVESYKAQVKHLEGLVMRNAVQACRFENFLRRIAYNPYSEVDSLALVRGVAKHAIEHTESLSSDDPKNLPAVWKRGVPVDDDKVWCSTCRENKHSVHVHFANDFTPAEGTRH